MQNRPDGQARPPGSSTVSTTTTQGPFTTTTTTTSHTTAGRGTNVIHYGPQSTTITSPTISTRTQVPAPRSLAPPPAPQRPHGTSIQIRRPSKQPSLQTLQPSQSAAHDQWQGNRRRSGSEPRPPPSAMLQDDTALQRHRTATPTLQPLYEDSAQTGHLAPGDGPPPSRRPSTRRQSLTRQISAINVRRKDHQEHQHTMQANVVDVLDVIGQCFHACYIPKLTLSSRSRDIRPHNSEQRSKLIISSQSAVALQSHAYVRTSAVRVRIFRRRSGRS